MLHLLETQIKEANTCACQQRISLPRDDTQSNMSEIYADNLDAICILFMCFPPEKSHLDGKTDSDKTIVIYLLKAFLQLERPLCYCLLSLLLFVMNL